MRQKWFCFCLVILVTLGFTGLAQAAEQNKGPWEKFSLRLAGFITNSDSSVRLGLPEIGTVIDPEEFLGVDSSTTVFRIDGFWRFSENRRHRLDFTWTAFRRSGTKTIGKDIDILGETIKLSTKINTSVDYDIYRVGYSYSFFQDDRIDLAIAGGLYVLPVRFGFEVEGLINETLAESITAPLPVLGLRADFVITPKVYLRNKADLFYLEFGSFKGTFLDLQLGVEYLPFKHFGFGASIELLDFEVEAKEEVWPGIDFVGNIGIEATGLMLYAKFYF